MPSLAAELKDSTASATVPPTGGSVTLPGFATVTFPASAFAASQAVTVTATSDSATQVDFEASGRSGVDPVPFEIRINTGELAPATDLEVELIVPSEFLTTLPPNHIVAAFAQFLEGGEEELHGFFEPLPSTLDPTIRTVRSALRRLAFRREWRHDETFEAIVKVGAIERILR